jgi:hypothetical protein
MKNTTLGRKAKEDMVKGAGEYKPRRTASQSGDGADFAFNGQMGDGVNRDGNRYAGNQSGLKAKENYGTKAFARRGNTSDQSVDRMESVGPSATRDKLKQTIATAKEGGKIDGGTKVKRPPNPDAIYVE